jgi:hypothetical protein
VAAAGAGRGSVTLDGNEEPSSSLAHRKEPQVTFRVAADLRANRLKEPLRWEVVTRAYLYFWLQPIRLGRLAYGVALIGKTVRTGASQAMASSCGTAGGEAGGEADGPGHPAGETDTGGDGPCSI